VKPRVALGPGREFDLIRRMLDRWGGAASGVGDDAVLLAVPAGERLVASADTSVEEVHFRRAWLTPHEIGWRATAAALSDLAAMGAEPLGVLVSLSIPERWLEALDHLADGIGEAARAAGAPIVGGDLTAAAQLAIAVTVLGHTAAPLERSGARAGDSLYVTGCLGGPGAALRAWLQGREPAADARSRFARPTPRLREGVWLARHGAHAAIDISDGLLGDAGHLAAASGVRLVLDLDRLPVLPGVNPTDAAASGEEYELLVAAPKLDAEAFARELGVALTPIGHVEAGPAEVDARLAGARVASPRGFDHFS
jgi:thiamine-monophosphate kinase